MVEGATYLPEVISPAVANVVRTQVRHSHDLCEDHWSGVMKSLNSQNHMGSHGTTLEKAPIIFLMYTDAGYPKNTSDRCSVSDVAMLFEERQYLPLVARRNI